jgi:hypothetical protein
MIEFFFIENNKAVMSVFQNFDFNGIVLRIVFF